MKLIILLLTILVLVYAVYAVRRRRVIERLELDNPSSRVVLVTFASEGVKSAQGLLLSEARDTGWFTDYETWDPARLRAEIPDCPAASESWVESHRRGYGYWSWKACVIHHAMETYSKRYPPDPDRPVFVVYLDAGCAINKQKGQRFKEYLHMAKMTGGVSFQLGADHSNARWCKASVLTLMEERQRSQPMMVATLTVLNVHAPNAQQTIREFRRLSVLNNAELLLDVDASTESPEFEDNRHDQCIWSLLIPHSGFTVLPDESFNSPHNPNPFIAKRRR